MLLGMTLTDTWRQFKKKNEEHDFTAEFSSIMAKKRLKYAKSFEDNQEGNVESISVPLSCDDISLLSQNKIVGTYSEIFLDAKHQLQCTWCS